MKMDMSMGSCSPPVQSKIYPPSESRKSCLSLFPSLSPYYVHGSMFPVCLPACLPLIVDLFSCFVFLLHTHTHTHTYIYISSCPQTICPSSDLASSMPDRQTCQTTTNPFSTPYRVISLFPPVSLAAISQRKHTY